jgi:hypothetical protein
MGRGISCGVAAPTELCSFAVMDPGLPTGWSGAVVLTADAVARLEATALSPGKALVPVDLLSGTLPEVTGFSEWGATQRSAAQTCVERLSAAAADVPTLTLEWADTPGLSLVCSERLLHSPGRIRTLAGPNSMDPLRGQ